MSEYYDAWLKVNAFVDNRDVDADFREAIFAEGQRVKRDVLQPRKLERRKVLLVGGAGYIGTPLTQFLLERGYSVRCLDLLLYENDRCVAPFVGNPNYEFQRADFADGNAVETALDAVTDVVVLGGLVGDPITKKYPSESGLINDEGVSNLVSSLNGRGLNKVLFISTCSNYGEIPANAVADEDFELKPLSLYAKSKVAMERQLLAGKGKVDYVGTALRFATAFGVSSRMRFDLTINEFTRNLWAGEELVVYDADTWRPYCHVQDFARGIARVLEAPRSAVDFAVFNMGGDENNFTKQMVVDELCKRIPGSRVKVVEGGVDRRNYRVDFRRVRERIFFEPSRTVGDGIGELLDALEKGLYADYERNRNFFGNYEINYPQPGR